MSINIMTEADCEKVKNAILCIIELIEMENELINSNQILALRKILDEKEFLFSIIMRYMPLIICILKNNTDALKHIELSHYDGIKEMFLHLLEVVRENNRRIAATLHITNSIMLSIKKNIRKYNKKLHIYSCHGKDLDKKSGLQSILLQTKV